MIANFQIIEKENIYALKFPSEEVLEDTDAIIQRRVDLNRAQTLGNIEHMKIKIYFEDDESKKVVETTVWAVTDNSVVLKKGVGIPINRIIKLI
ncbi:hypothetical protein [Flavobacterium sp. K5-23]|uniref:hypothetical protein n=1 Tax=Flavobacterium sp. K5-23 TaxID=2746225 RepID=UPI00200E703C|nr:hypothetical protein [Flavobacterium sp. K5-23]UQD56849.1 hypothetical protein FLAK523_10775 [Flavobacterium sp. K5-23]